MPRYDIRVTERVTHDIRVTADDPEAALQELARLLQSGEPFSAKMVKSDGMQMSPLLSRPRLVEEGRS